MNYHFAIAVVTRDGKVLGYSAPMEITREELFNALKLGYDSYRIVEAVVKELGYKPPRNITVKTEDYEVTVFNRGTRFVIAVFREETIPVATTRSTALAEA